jgi:hypothetical protein
VLVVSLVLPLGSKFGECKTSTACGAALDPYQDAPGMSFVLYLFMLDEFGTSGVCGEERISLNKCSRTYRARTIRKKCARHLVRMHSRLDLDRTRARIDVRPPVRYRSLRMHNLFGTSSPGPVVVRHLQGGGSRKSVSGKSLPAWSRQSGFVGHAEEASNCGRGYCAAAEMKRDLSRSISAGKRRRAIMSRPALVSTARCQRRMANHGECTS